MYKSQGAPHVFSLMMRNEDGQLRKHIEQKFGYQANWWLDLLALSLYTLIGFLGGVASIGIMLNNTEITNAALLSMVLLGVYALVVMLIIGWSYKFDPNYQQIDKRTVNEGGEESGKN